MNNENTLYQTLIKDGGVNNSIRLLDKNESAVSRLLYKIGFSSVLLRETKEQNDVIVTEYRASSENGSVTYITIRESEYDEQRHVELIDFYATELGNVCEIPGITVSLRYKNVANDRIWCWLGCSSSYYIKNLDHEQGRGQYIIRGEDDLISVLMKLKDNLRTHLYALAHALDIPIVIC